MCNTHTYVDGFVYVMYNTSIYMHTTHVYITQTSKHLDMYIMYCF